MTRTVVMVPSYLRATSYHTLQDSRKIPSLFNTRYVHKVIWTINIGIFSITVERCFKLGEGTSGPTAQTAGQQSRQRPARTHNGLVRMNHQVLMDAQKRKIRTTAQNPATRLAEAVFDTTRTRTAVFADRHRAEFSNLQIKSNCHSGFQCLNPLK